MNAHLETDARRATSRRRHASHSLTPDSRICDRDHCIKGLSGWSIEDVPFMMDESLRTFLSTCENAMDLGLLTVRRSEDANLIRILNINQHVIITS